MSETVKLREISSSTEGPAGAAPNQKRPGNAWLPIDVASRIILLFSALCLVKFAILWSFREHLFEIHWRVGTEAFNWLNVVAFYSFALLAGVNIWILGRGCARVGAIQVRFCNLCVCVIAGLFILLTFHEGDKNYLYAVMNDILKFKDLRWYLILNSCFRMPFLAAWIFVYIATYYILFRTKREKWVLCATAIFGAVYIAVCLRDLMVYGDALVVADCFGIACCLSPAGRKRSAIFRLILPVVLGAFLFVLFAPYHSDLSFFGLPPQFAMLFWFSMVLFAGISVYAVVRGFFAPWVEVAPFALVAFFLLTNTGYPVSPNYRNLLCTSLMLPHYFLGELLLVAVILLMAIGYRRLRPKGNLIWLDILTLIVVAIALADLRLCQIMGTRLDWDVLSLAFGETPKMMWRMARPYLPALLGVLAVISVLYAGLIWISRRLGHKVAQSRNAMMPGETRFIWLTLLLLGFAGKDLIKRDKAEGQTLYRMAETSPLLRRASSPVMDYATFCKKVKELGLDDMLKPHPAISGESKRDLNLIIVFQESTYNKHLSLFGSSEDTEPLLSKYKDRMEIFPKFFSSFTGSINARFATFTGLYPVRDYNAFTTRRVPVKSLFEVLNENGYDCSMFYSSFFDYTGFRDFLRGRGIEGLYDADTMPGERKTPPVSWGLHEDETLDAIQNQIKRYAAADRKFFLTYVPAAPHNPFDGTPQRFQKYQREKMGDFSPLYRNELLYMDWVLASIIDQLKDSGILDKTVVVITGDHGEMLGENDGPVGHGWRVTPELQNVPLIIMDPGHPNYHINDRIGSQVDLMPTLLDLLRIPLPEGQLYQGTSLYSPDLDPERTIYINSFRQFGIIRGSKFICGDRESDAGGVAADSQNIFTITNAAEHCVFVASSDTNACSIEAFDSFQENFLRNYDEYRQMHRNATGNADRAAQ